MTAITETDIGRGLGIDYFLLRSELTAEELAYLDRTRQFVDEEVLPVMPGHWERAELPLDLARRLGSLATLLGVQAGLAMRSIAAFGGEQHKQRWLPQMARMEALGAFALTEPEHGSDSVALETIARRVGRES